ncbi:MAG: FtsX-like permease family protein [Bacteroidota bacterium]
MNFKLAWRNIWRNKKRTWITASSIGFAVFFACVMQSMQLGSYERMIDNSVRFLTGHIGIHQLDYWDEKILDNSFPEASIADLDITHESIIMSVPRITSFALASYEDKTKGALITGVDLSLEAEFSYLENKLEEGIYNTDAGALIGEGLSEYLKLGVGDTLVLLSQGYHGVNAVGKYPVDGILKFPVPDLNQSAVYLPIKTAQAFFGAEGMITSYSVLLDDPDATEEVQGQLIKQSEVFEAMTWKEMMPDLVQGIELDYYGGLVMVFVLYGVIGFGIFGTFLMMTKERTYEFGILNSIGMKKGRIQQMVAIEILLLSFLGVILGLIAASPIVLYFWANPILLTGETAAAMEKFGYEPIMPFALDPKVFYDQGISILLIALFLGIYPMLAIKQLKIIKALKQ